MVRAAPTRDAYRCQDVPRTRWQDAQVEGHDLTNSRGTCGGAGSVSNLTPITLLALMSIGVKKPPLFLGLDNITSIATAVARVQSC